LAGRLRADVPKFVRTASEHSTDTRIAERAKLEVQGLRQRDDRVLGDAIRAERPCEGSKIDAVFTMCLASCSSGSRDECPDR
jgi:hypothetical protein